MSPRVTSLLQRAGKALLYACAAIGIGLGANLAYTRLMQPASCCYPGSPCCHAGSPCCNHSHGAQ
jgi:hypothetical protein